MIKTITAIHVDDDDRSIALFKNAANKIPELALEASFTDTAAALEYLGNHKVDILFSDVEMPNGNGLWLADQLSKGNMDIVFVSAHAGYAINAFEACALDYLMKPVQASRLQQVVTRKQLKQPIARQNPQEQLREVFEHYIDKKSIPLKIFVQVDSDLHIVPLEDVIYFSASGAYTKVLRRSGKTLLSYKVIGTYDDALKDHPDFIRIHRSFLINKSAVQILHKTEAVFNVTMENGDKLEVSRRRKDEVMKKLST